MTESDPVQRIAAAIARVPPGRVATYGGIARVAGLPGRARLVGTVLKQAPDDAALPWHRIVNASGRSSLPQGTAAHREQLRRLRDEGVVIRSGRIDLARHGWPPTDADLDRVLWGRGDAANRGRQTRDGGA